MSRNFFDIINKDAKKAVISLAATGTVVAAVTGKKIRVLAYTIVGGGTATVTFKSGAAGTALTGAMSLVVNSVLSVPYCEAGHFETAASALLELSLGASVAMAGHLTYVEVD